MSSIGSRSGGARSTKKPMWPVYIMVMLMFIGFIGIGPVGAFTGIQIVHSTYQYAVFNTFSTLTTSGGGGFITTSWLPSWLDAGTFLALLQTIFSAIMLAVYALREMI